MAPSRRKSLVQTTPTQSQPISLLQSSSFSYEPHNDGPSFLTDIDYYSEGMPTRESDDDDDPYTPTTLVSEPSWGIHHSRSTVGFPSTVSSLIDDITKAIVGTVNGKQTLDPNYIVNAMMGNNTVGRRPVRRSFDAGRIGVELDGLALLYDGRLSEPNALRKVALQLAAHLSSEQNIKVAVYFNTIRQTLMASQELQFLRRVEMQSKRQGDTKSVYNNITVLTLGADDIPKSMRRQERLKSPQLGQGQVDLKRGLIMVIQPTDYNAEYRPPAPSIGSVAALQRLAGRASVDGIPVVLLSPRFLTLQAPSPGWDQSGYQQSSAYGGYEPARGPTPWIMRDFSPPVYCWSNRATMLTSAEQPFRQDCDLALLQSVMIEGHAWHVFAKQRSARQNDYVYLASTQSAAGRPTQEVLQRIHHEFAMTDEPQSPSSGQR